MPTTADDSTSQDVRPGDARYSEYSSPLVSRNASPEMARLFSPQRKFSTWRRVWLALAEAQHELGLAQVTAEALAELREHLDDIDFARAAEHEKRLRHDVMAHIHTLGEVAPLARPILHLGATSAEITDNTDLILMRRGLKLIGLRLANIIDQLANFAVTWRSEPTLGYTHFQPAQLTTVGKRSTLWIYDFVLDLQEVEHHIRNLRFRGIKGTTGTQASMLQLFDGDHDKCRQIDQLVASKLGFDHTYAVTGQTYPRKVDAHVVGLLAEIAASVHKFANDIRLLQSLRQLSEPFEAEQVGSSAMAYKQNPMRSERATALARLVISLANSPLQTAAEQWLERTLDDSANRRVVIPEAFLAIDGALAIVLNIASGLSVNTQVIAAAVGAELPFMATEEILMAAVRAGADRQDVHEVIRTHSLAAAQQVKAGEANDLIERLRSDRLMQRLAATPGSDGQAFNLDRLMDPARFIGRSAEQVDEFLRDVVTPIRERYAGFLGQRVDLKV